ncbi:ribosomal protein S18 acetylase RimI-like enzyme [Leucobacter exalbidus]|uniref:Ribosomal protein S18 acetylase RimI-like enzyme n=1 Tax=Leucobacter exalbidus TaxID=662960 RepID=A0A940SZK0_9MICO|nr:GNAT family acetyltransferase [Leucobacter exalbidus]MBP1324975.1 ribosomal protein S18 acetylase RimI-like enzyme [Leucobacter exalbidus]
MHSHADTFTIREFREADTEQTVALWEACELIRPWNDPRADIARKLTTQPELFLVAEDAGPAAGASAQATPRIVGSVMAGYDGHRGWMFYLATAPSHRGRGIARALVAEIETRLEARGCPKAQLLVRADNAQAVGFYRALGYDVSDVLVLGKRLIEDETPA